MKHMSSRTIIRIVTFLFLIIAIFVAYFAIVNWRAQYAYNTATDSLISNIKSAKSIDSDKNVLLTQQQQTDAQFDDAKSQEMILLPQLRNSIDKNAELSRKLTEKLKQNQNNTNKQQKTKKHNNHFKNDNSNNSSKDKKQSDSSKPQLSNAQRNKVENLLKQNDHVDSQSSQNQEDQQGLEKTEKRTKTDESSNKPW